MRRHKLLRPLLIRALCVGFLGGTLCAIFINPVYAQIQTDDLNTSALNGDVAAQLALAQRYHTGVGVLQNYTTAANWALKAAQQGSADAQNLLARYYSTGLGRKKDAKHVLFWMEKSATSGAPQYLYDLGLLLEANAPQDAARAYDNAMQAGHTQAPVNLGMLYQTGRGVAQDFDHAHALYKVAAEAGSARAQNNLGLLYVRGHGVAQNYEQAAKLFTAAANQGLKQAMGNLGVLYENGFGVEINEALAADLYRQAGQASSNHTATTIRAPEKPGPYLVYDPRFAPMTSFDPDTLHSLQLTAQSGDPVAQFQLSWALLHKPTSNNTDARASAALFTDAAAAGHAPAMSNLGVLYFEGIGLPQDYVLGQMWLIRAALSGLEDLRPVMQIYATWPSPAQLNHAQAIAIQTKPRISAANWNTQYQPQVGGKIRTYQISLFVIMLTNYKLMPVPIFSISI